MQKIIFNVLKIISQKIIQKYNPKIIGITGSIGKTSTKETVYAVLTSKFENVRKSEKNYNNEIGVPLTIIGKKSPNKSVIGWLFVIFKGIWLLIWKTKKYPKLIVLEMAADRIGDIKYLVDIAPCDIGILTKIGFAHFEFFKSVDKIAREKRFIISHLSKNDTAILNMDDEIVMKQKDYTKAKVLTYGFNKDADIQAIELETSGHGLDVEGIKFKLLYKGSVVPIFLPNIVGKNSIYAAMAAASVGVNLGMNLVEIAQGLKNYKSPKGRMNLVEGIKHTLIIDDTYNAASPEGVVAALEVLEKFEIEQNNKKFAVLGNMLELGSYTEEAHEIIGKLVFDLKIDQLITVGEQGMLIAKAAKDAGMEEDSVFTFDYSEEAGRFLQDRMKKGDIILVKGAQGVRMEKIVKEVMAEPLRAKELLVRQEESWENK